MPVSKLLSVSIPDELMEGTEALARDQGRTKSEVVREALKAHLLQSRLEVVWAYGDDWAEAQGIAPEDVESLIDEVRAARRAAGA